MRKLESNQNIDKCSSSPWKVHCWSHWIYIVKVGPNGSIDRLNAQLVAKGYTQVFSLDYFSSTVKIVFVHLFSLAAMQTSCFILSIRH